MRKLIYVPIIHTEADMGRVAPELEARTASLFGDKRWAKHKATVSEFWQSLATHFDRIKATNLKIYQDGLVAEGELGQKIVAQAAQRGSKNHQIILNLLNRGAEIRKTEDASLLRQEYERIIKLTQAKSLLERILAYFRHNLGKDRLAQKRDRFIAKTINESLKEGETALLFIGAYHDVLPYLAKDIVVEQAKEQRKVKAYFEELISGRDEDRFEQLAQYLTSEA